MTVLMRSSLKSVEPLASALAVRQEDVQPEIFMQLRKLDTLLQTAIARARLAMAGTAHDSALHGLYISEEEIDQLMERESGAAIGFHPDLAEARLTFLDSSRMPVIGARWGFTDFDNAVLILAAAPELDLRYERLYAYLQDDVTKRMPTVDLALNLLCADPEERIEARKRFALRAPLIRSGILRLVPDPALIDPPLLAHYLRADVRAINALLGDNALDGRLASFCKYSAPYEQSADSDDQAGILRRLPAFVTRAQASGHPIRLMFSGPAASSKRQAAAALAHRVGKALLTADLRGAEWLSNPAATASLLTREAEFTGSLLYVSGLRQSQAEPDPARLFVQALIDHSVPIVITSEDASLGLLAGDGFLDIPFALPDYDARHALWQSLAAEAGITADAVTLDSLAANFVLASNEIAAAVNTARQRMEWLATASGGLKATDFAAELLAAARRQTGGELAVLTSKVAPVHRWDDIVLAAEELEQLKEICARVTLGHAVMKEGGFGKKLSSGKGIAALFAGPSGTGKTMAAEVIANELGFDLFRIDLSRVVSKYIGETEQNLERIFNAAGRSNSVLLFDEADSLLGKRSAVHDAHDRYANIEISYLLQKMEQYEGITILTTNLRGNIDDAFLRRLAFTIHFPFPEEEARLRIWSKIWPTETLVDRDVDAAVLAQQFRLSGGNICNVALAAAFLAAAEARAVRMSDILRALQREYAKLGKATTLAELQDMVGPQC